MFKNRISNIAHSKAGYALRWMIRRDLRNVVEIETMCFKKYYDTQKLSRLLSRRNTIGMVITLPDQRSKNHFVAAYCIYDLEAESIRFRRFVVHPNCRRIGLGSDLMKKILGKLNERRSRIELVVRECNLEAQLFLRSHGFKAEQIIREMYEDTPEDGYIMRHRSASMIDSRSFKLPF